MLVNTFNVYVYMIYNGELYQSVYPIGTCGIVKLTLYELTFIVNITNNS